MKRAAMEHQQTYHRWKQHHDDHLLKERGPEPPRVDCRCDLQIGRFRKGQKRFGCGKTRCYLCHGEKLLGIPKHRDRRMALTAKEEL